MKMELQDGISERCHCTKNEVSNKDFFTKYDYIRRKLLMNNFIFMQCVFSLKI